MKIHSTGFVEHRSEGERDLPRFVFTVSEILIPGACTTCSWGVGCSCCCSCGALAVND